MSRNNSGIIRVSKTIYTTAINGTSPAAMLECKGFKKWTFQLSGTWTGASVLIQGTGDNQTAGSIIAPGTGTAWFNLLPYSGGNNPLTDNSQQLEYSEGLLAVRVVVTGIASGTVNVICAAYP